MKTVLKVLGAIVVVAALTFGIWKILDSRAAGLHEKA